MENALACLFADGVMNFVYQDDFGTLDAENFNSDLILSVADFAGGMQWPAYFPRLLGAYFMVVNAIPKWVLARWLKSVSRPIECMKVSSPSLLATFGSSVFFATFPSD